MRIETHTATDRHLVHVAMERRTLIALLAIIGATALTCGPLLILTDGLGMSHEELRGTPFTSFVIPGMILGLVVGGSSLIGFWLQITRQQRARLASIAAGAILLGWIVIEAFMIHAGRGLQFAIFITALTIIGLSYRLP